MLTGAEVAAHNNRDSCWVIIHGKAYDVTDFLPGTPPTPHAYPVLLDGLPELKLTNSQSTPEA